MRTASASPPQPHNLVAANRLALRSLRRQWFLAAALAIPALGAGYVLLAQSSFEAYVERWLLLASLVAAVILGFVWHVLPRNHRLGDERLFARLGAGTWLTLLSGLLLAYLAGFLFGPWPAEWMAWLPAALYLTSRIVDLFDGYVARISDHVTDAGAALDIELDGLGLLIAVGLSVWYGQASRLVPAAGCEPPALRGGHVVAHAQGKTGLRSASERQPSHYRRLPDGLHRYRPLACGSPSGDHAGSRRFRRAPDCKFRSRLVGGQRRH